MKGDEKMNDELNKEKKIYEYLNNKEINSEKLMARNPSWLVSILYRKGQIFKNIHLKDINLTASEQPIINLLYLDDGLSQDNISKLLDIDKALTARIIQSLLSKGYIEKIRDKEDKRINRIFLSKEGQKLIEPLSNVLNDWQEILTSNMTEEEKNIVYSCLLKMVGNVKNYINSDV